MLVSVVRKDGVSEMFDCARISVVTEQGELKDHVMVTFEGMRDGAVTIHYHKSSTSIYVMNDHGKTVESYRWS